MGTNAFGIFNCVQQLVPHMNPGGAFAVIASASAMRGTPMLPTSVPSKIIPQS